MVHDRDLVAMLKEDPARGIKVALDCYGGAINKICETYLRGYPKEDIEETVSDCYVELWRSIDRFDLTRNVNLKNYFYGIARIQSLNQRRKLAKIGRWKWTDYEGMKETGREIPDPCDIEQEVEDKIESEKVLELINRMPYPDQEIFRLRYVKVHSEKEIAKQVDLSVKAVESRLARGRKRLRKQLSDCGVIV